MKLNLSSLAVAALMALSSVSYAQAPTFEWGNAAFNVHAMTTDMERNVYVYHAFSGTVTVNTLTDTLNLNSTNGGYFVSKYTPNGDMLWAKQTKISPKGFAYANGNLQLEGQITSGDDADLGTGTVVANSSGTIIMKMDTAANYIAATINADLLIGYAHNAHDEAGNFYLYAQNGANAVDLDPSAATSTMPANMCYIAKYNANGDFLYSTQLTTSSNFSIGRMAVKNGYTYIAFTLYDSVVVAGTTYMGDAMTGTLYLAKVNSSTGALSWVRAAAGGIGGSALGMGISQNGSIGMLFDSYGAVGTVDYDPSNANFPVTHAAMNELTYVRFDEQGNFITAARTPTQSSITIDSDYMAIKFDDFGSFYVLIANSWAGTYNVSMDDANPTNISVADGYAVLLKYNADASLEFAEVSETEFFNGQIILDNQGDIILELSRNANGTAVDVDFTAGTANRDLVAPTRSLLSKYSQSTFVGVAQNQTAEAMRLYPNPTDGLLNLENAPVGQQLRITDALGRQVFSTKINQAATQINTNHLPNGLYLIQAGQQPAQKLIIAK